VPTSANVPTDASVPTVSNSAGSCLRANLRTAQRERN
jgi:hypothetical protein